MIVVSQIPEDPDDLLDTDEDNYEFKGILTEESFLELVIKYMSEDIEEDD